MKALARWLYMQTHNAELVRVKMYAKSRVGGVIANPQTGLVMAGEAQGAIDTLTTLNLLADG